MGCIKWRNCPFQVKSCWIFVLCLAPWRFGTQSNTAISTYSHFPVVILFTFNESLDEKLSNHRQMSMGNLQLNNSSISDHQCNYIYIYTSSTAQGGGGSFKNRKPIGELGCCESGMAERIHWWTERCLRSPLFLSLPFSDYLPTYLSIFYVSIYLSIDLSLSLSLSFI